LSALSSLFGLAPQLPLGTLVVMVLGESVRPWLSLADETRRLADREITRMN
jgi:hypothetical protein